MIEEFKKPIAREIIAVVTSLLIESITNRMTLMETEQQLKAISVGTKYGVCKGPDVNNCLTAKRYIDEVTGSISHGSYSLGVKVDG